jgi:hypothetical protein
MSDHFWKSFGAVILLLIGLLFGESPLGPVIIGIVEGAMNIEFRRELGREVGQTARDQLKSWVAEQQRIAKQRSENTHAVFASRITGYPQYCGRNPNDEIKCCNDHSTQLAIQYEGALSPYEYADVQFREYCY